MAIPGAHGIAMPRATRELFSDLNRSLRPGSCRHAFTHENYSVNGTGRSISHGAHFFRHPIIIHLNPSDMSRGTGSERLKVGYLEMLTQKTVFTDREIQLFRTFTSPSKHERFEVLLRSRKGRLKVCHDLDHFAISICAIARDSSALSKASPGFSPFSKPSERRAFATSFLQTANLTGWN